MIGAFDAWAESARAIVVGCGGVGGSVLAHLRSQGRHVVAVTGNAEITKAIGAHGLRASLPGGVRIERIDVVTRAAALPTGPYDIAFLAVPPNRMEGAAADVLPALGARGVLVPLANGLPEERLVAALGAAVADRVVGCIVGFGASMTRPGVVEQTSEGGLTLGKLSGAVDDDVQRVAAFVRPVDREVELSTNLRGARWSKLAINCAISSLGTIGGDRLGALMRHRFVRRLCLEVMTEATQVAIALGVKLEKIAGTIDLEWIALDDEERLAAGSPGLLAKHTVLLAVGARYRRLRSSMLLAIERGREPPVDYLNGEVVRCAEGLNLRVPVNAAIVDAVKQIARAERAPSFDGLRRLFDDTRATLKELRLAA
ncbi:MAG TPA: 2-dehydropantoate 2-reductase [Myxococcota bacterium]|jgi:2-dehydropantoate 2-reductase